MKRVFFLCILLALLSASCQKNKIIPDQCPLQVLTPSLKNQKISKVLCANGLPLLIISDPNTTTSGAALVVKTGSNADPISTPGLAHFTEHCVFLGNRLYPATSGFPTLLSQHNGTYNAFTSSNTTSYLFSVDSEAFAEALDQFVHLFIEPLFRQEDLDREKHAVHQEFAINTTKDSRRLFRVQQLVAPRGYPLAKFSCGNLDSLGAVTTEDMKTWFYSHYSPENCVAIIYTSEPIGKAQSFASYFAKIPVSGAYIPEVAYPVVEDISTPSLFFLKSVQSTSSMEIYWHLYHGEPIISKGCYQTLLSLLRHEGPDSLVTRLKEEQLISDVNVGCDKSSLNTDELYICFKLTELGEREHIRVIQYTMDYLNFIKSQGMPAFCLEELSTLNRYNYCYKTRTDIFENLACQINLLAEEPLATYPYNSLIFAPYTPEEEASLLTKVTDPSRLRCVLSAQHPERLDRTQEHYDPVYHISYYEMPLTLGPTKNTWKLPQPNPYLPNQLVTPEAPETLPTTGFPFSPELVYHDDHLTMYTCKDSYYTAPQTALALRIRSPEIAITDPTTLVLTDLLCLATNNSLSLPLYPAKKAGSSVSLSSGGDGIDLCILSFTDTLTDLLKTALSAFDQITPSHFTYYKQQLEERYRQRISLCPIRFGMDELQAQALTIPAYSTKLKALETLTYETTYSFISKVLQKNHIEVLIFGDVTTEQKEQLISQLLAFSSSPYAAQPFRVQFAPYIPTSLTVNYPLSGNGILLFLYRESFDAKDFVATEILCKWLYHHYFERLRTQEQLGYMVGTAYREIAMSPGIVFYIRSDAYSPEELLDRTQVFIEQAINSFLFSFSEQEFSTAISAYIRDLLHPSVSMDEMAKTLFSKQFEKPYPSFQDKIDAAQNLGYTDFVTFSEQFLQSHQISVLIQGLPEKAVEEFGDILQEPEYK